jgi:anthranilate synthase/phosphoribosyltransferase
MIALIDNYDSFTHNLYQYLSQLTDEEIRVFRNDRISVNQLAKLEPSRIVISPGPGRPEGAGISVEAIRRFAGEVPILGVCLGHQAIAVAFGGRVVGAKEIVHGKTDRIAVDGRGVFRAINSPAEFARYHSLAVAEDDLPAELEVSARSPDGEIMGIRHVKHAIEGVQFHPESVASDEGMKLLGNFLSYRREPFEPRKYLTRIIDGASLTQHEASEFMEELTDGHLTDAQIAAFLVALNAKGIEATEVAGCAQVLQRKHTPLTVRGPLLDTCGTGGDGLGTHNISSLTALLAASCGARVAKHGNRAVSSRSGSADFYTALGINIETTPRQAAVSISDAGFAFLYAPLYHGAMRFAGPARRQLGIKTIMNLLGPLANPAGAEFQLIGVFSERHLRTVAEAAVRLGVRRGMVVHGLDGQDELSVCAPTRVISFEVAEGEIGAAGSQDEGPGAAATSRSAGKPAAASGASVFAGPGATATDAGASSGGEGAGASPSAPPLDPTALGDQRIAAATFEEFVVQPETYGLALHPATAMVGGTPEENATLALRLLSGENGLGPEGIVEPALAALHDSVVFNTAAALKVYGIVQTLQDGVETAIRAIEEGRGMQTLERVIAISRTSTIPAAVSEGTGAARSGSAAAGSATGGTGNARGGAGRAG